MDRQTRSTLLRTLIVFTILLGSVGTAARAAGQSEQAPSLSTSIHLPAIFNYYSPQPNMFGVEVAGGDPQTLMALGSGGADWVRRNGVMWSEVEPIEGQRLWSSQSVLDDSLKQAAVKNLRVILIVRHAPLWARQDTNSNCGPIRSDKLPAFASFMHDVVARYSAAPYHVRYFEVWNEPDVPINTGGEPYGCWGVPGDPYYGGMAFGQMLKQVYPQMKAANPQARAVLGGLLLDCDPNNPPETSPGSGQLKDCHASRFLEGILRAGAGQSFDDLSFHGYDYYAGAVHQYSNFNWHAAWNSTGPVVMAKVAFLRSVMQTFGIDKPLMNTELALLCHESIAATCGSDFEATKADYLAISYAEMARAGLFGGTWYDATGGWRKSGLLDGSGQPLPAYHAFRTAEAHLGLAHFESEIVQPGLKIYVFNSLRGRFWVAWSIDGQTHNYQLPGMPVSIWSATGNAITPAIYVQLGPSPIYINWTH